MEKIKHEWKSVYVGSNPEGKPIFKRRKVPVLKPGQIPPEPPNLDSTLTPPKDIGIPDWQKPDLKD